ncbi:MAG: hypothetical protein GWN58_67525 [Anaerolineae bacterium]|nr:hypothetical protein [Anaerolineae bacterium]
MTSAPSDVGDGGALTYIGQDEIIAIRGDKEDDLWKYSISGDSWETLEPAPDTIGEGGAVTFPEDDYIFVMRGDNSTDFWRYLAAPPKYDITAQAGATKLTARILLDRPQAEVLWWDFQ